MAYFESCIIGKAWFDAIKEKVTYKNLFLDEKTGYCEADFEYFRFRRASVKEGFMYAHELPAMDLIEQYNASINTTFQNLLDTITYRENNLSMTLEQVTEEMEGIDWLIEKLAEYKDKLGYIADRLDNEETLANQ